MTETQEIFEHAPHPPRGPHLDLPADFIPLQFSIAPRHLQVEILRPSIVIGRHTNADLRLADPEVSRHHCRLLFENGQWRVLDLQSTNGVYVNNTRIVEAVLYTGDLLFVGSVKLLIKSATPIRVLKGAEADKLKQIAKQLPTEQPRLAS